MWRRCDLHNHTTPNDKDESSFDAEVFVTSCISQGLDVVAVTDHDQVKNVEPVIETAAGRELTIVPGVEISTDRGHVLVLAPGSQGLGVIREFCTRIGAVPGTQVLYNALIDIARTGSLMSGESFREFLVLIGAHVEREGSLLGPGQALSVDTQLRDAAQLEAIEVADEATRKEWLSSGVKQQGQILTIVQGSDSHSTDARIDRFTWIYLPEVAARTLQHALATPEASIRFGEPPTLPSRVIHEISFEGGMYDGLVLRFGERANAVIGPPSSGKSLIIDAIRWCLGQLCELEEIAQVCESRLSHCLPPGTIVRLRGKCDGKPFEIERVRGGALPPSPPFLPIIFSQTELVRRAMEARPSMRLLDLHCPLSSELQERILNERQEIAGLLSALVEKARQAREMAAVVSNPIDGLSAAKRQIEELAGTEPMAQLANDLSRVRSWRIQLREEIPAWRGQLETPKGPRVPQPPTLETDKLDTDRLIPLTQVEVEIQSFRTAVEQGANDLERALLDLVDRSEEDFAETERATTDSLAKEGFEEGQEVLSKLNELRTRLVDLEQKDVNLRQLEQEIDGGVADLLLRVRAVGHLYEQLRELRKDACREVNESMRAFFARLIPDQLVQELDTLLEDAKVGTHLWATNIPDLRNNLDRERLAESAVRFAQGRPDKLAVRPDAVVQDAVVQASLDRVKVTQLAAIATTWPNDALDLCEHGSPPVPFDKLTEGMRALAIKEISFAASSLPVITDQPEDAVPSKAVFDTLVPTLREQRSERQFVLASHDANIVVAGDVEVVWVLGIEGGPIEGMLFDEQIREAALELLEGGKEAFDIRSRRYGSARFS